MIAKYFICGILSDGFTYSVLIAVKLAKISAGKSSIRLSGNKLQLKKKGETIKKGYHSSHH